VLNHRGPPHSGDPDSRSKEVVWIRQQMQQVAQALKKYPDDSQFPLASLRKALAGPQAKSSSPRVRSSDRIS
jgi:hypothetical protein